MATVLAQLDDAIASRETSAMLRCGNVQVRVTNLAKVYFAKGAPGARTKGDLLRYYVQMARTILPHLHERPVVLTRYPGGAGNKGFYVQRAPVERPTWVTTCVTSLKPPTKLEYLSLDSVAALLWAANLGGFEIHPWYSRCSAPTQPDFLVIDLDPVPGVRFAKVRSAALRVRDAFELWKLPSFVKTSGATGLHLFVPIKRGPLQEEVHDVARGIAAAVEAQHPKVFTTQYRIEARPRGRVLLDHNQNARGHHLAGPYSVRPTSTATVSTPVEWSEIEEGVDPKDFTMATVPSRLTSIPDPWAAKRIAKARIDLMAWRARVLQGA